MCTLSALRNAHRRTDSYAGRLTQIKFTCTMDVFFCIVRVYVYIAYQERYCVCNEYFYKHVCRGGDILYPYRYACTVYISGVVH